MYYSSRTSVKQLVVLAFVLLASGFASGRYAASDAVSGAEKLARKAQTTADAVGAQLLAHHTNSLGCIERLRKAVLELEKQIRAEVNLAKKGCPVGEPPLSVE